MREALPGVRTELWDFVNRAEITPKLKIANIIFIFGIMKFYF